VLKADAHTVQQLAGQVSRLLRRLHLYGLIAWVQRMGEANSNIPTARIRGSCTPLSRLARNTKLNMADCRPLSKDRS
jgi:hypothetical protein